MKGEIREGYYPLYAPDGAKNGYAAFSFLGNQLEIRVRIDRVPPAVREVTGFFTDRAHSLPEGKPILRIKRERTSAFGNVRLSDPTPFLPDGSFDFTFFVDNRPFAFTALYTEPEPELKPEPEPEPEPPEPEPSRDLITFDPFHTTNPAYRWWLCQKEEVLYGMLEDTGIVPPPELYTALQNALVRYGHVLLGSYQDPESDLLLTIFGVPVANGMPPQSAGSGRWVPARERIPTQNGYAGYWLYYFNPRTGKAVRAIVRS